MIDRKMATVHELFKRLRLRRSQHKKVKDKENSGCQLGSRTGVALPPLPPPGFLNLPDVSRDCVVQSSSKVYDEIPAYAIDTRLDILRDAYMERKRNHVITTRSSQNASMEHGQDPGQDHRDRGQFSLPRRGAPDCHAASAASLPRNGTPWNQGLVLDCSDQLDQWVSVPESLNTVHLDDRVSGSYRGRNHGIDPEHRHPWYEEDNPSGLQCDLRDRAATMEQNSFHGSLNNIQASSYLLSKSDRHGETSRTCARNGGGQKQYASPPPGALSDDSGVSSPSSREGADTSWGSVTVQRHALRHYRQYSDSDSSSTYSHKPPGSRNRWCDRDNEKQLPGVDRSQSDSSIQGRLDVSSSDTYNEYDQNTFSFSDFDSLPRRYADPTGAKTNESMSPQQYTFYLGKIQKNLRKTHSVKDLTDSDGNDTDLIQTDWDTTCNSPDLTSVTSLSEISTLSEREIHELLRQERHPVEPDQSQLHTRLPGRNPASESCTDPSRRQPPTNGQESAFKPYSSSKRPPNQTLSSTLSARPDQIRTHLPSGDMTLADRLSCRVTTSKPPRPLSARVKGSTSQLHVRNVGVRGPNPGTTQNLLLSDLMRRNHDRQILVVI